MMAACNTRAVFAARTTPRVARAAVTVRAGLFDGGKQKAKEAARNVSQGTKSIRNAKKPINRSNQNDNILPVEPGFTKDNEVLVGRFAMFGFAAALVSEAFTHKGIIGQVSQFLHISPGTTEGLFWVIALSSGIWASLPVSKTFDEENQESLKTRPKGPLQDPNINLASDPKRTLGISGFGFTKPNETVVGRLAMLGFVAALIGEKATGKGPLAQIGLENYPVAGVLFAAFISFTFFAAIGTGRYGGKEYSKEQY